MIRVGDASSPVLLPGDDLFGLEAGISAAAVSSSVHRGFLDMQLSGNLSMGVTAGLGVQDPGTGAADGNELFHSSQVIPGRAQC